MRMWRKRRGLFRNGCADSRVRWGQLINAFKAKFGQEPEQIVRAPGRVNVLGEHVDYSLFVSHFRYRSPSPCSLPLSDTMSCLLSAPVQETAALASP